MSRPRPVILTPLALALAATALLGACSDTKTLSQSDLRNLIQNDLAAELGRPLTGATCPDVKDPVDGTTFECTATIDNQTLRIRAEVTDASTNFVVVANADAIIPTADLESTISEDFTDQLGFEVSVDCGDTEVIVAAPETQLNCTATDPTNESANVVVNVQDAEGNVTYELE